MCSGIIDSFYFLFSEQRIKAIIGKGFDLDWKCHYEAMALKLEFNKLIVKLRQIIKDYPEQEFPDLYQHLKMIRAANDTFRNYIIMSLGNISATSGIHHVGAPGAMSTPEQNETKMQSTFLNSQAVPTESHRTGILETFNTPSGINQRTSSVVRSLRQTLDEMRSARSGGTRQRSGGLSTGRVVRHRKRTPTYNVSRTNLPRRRMNFQRSLTTPQTQ